MPRVNQMTLLYTSPVAVSFVMQFLNQVCGRHTPSFLKLFLFRRLYVYVCVYVCVRVRVHVCVCPQGY